MTKTIDWRDVFCGRAEELSILVDKFKDVQAGRGPRIAVVLGDRGMGKTRLVQELYRVLTSQHDPVNYWPDASLFKGNNLLVAPELTDPSVQAHYRSFKIEERPMPFLWWGFRLSDPTARNANRNDMAGHRATLDPHLAPVFFARRLAAVREQLKSAGVDTATELGKSLIIKALVAVIPGLAIAASAFELFMQYADKGKKAVEAVQDEHRLREQQRVDLARTDRDRDDDIHRRTLNDLAALLAPGPEVTPLPTVVFCDDAQFARQGGDEGAMRFLNDAWLGAHLANWPLLMVLTHWGVEWHRDSDQPQERSCAAAFSKSGATARYGALIELPKESALAELVRSGLPGLPSADVTLLLAKADGNPQVLIEVVDLVRRSPAWRRRSSGGLTPHARKEIELRATSLAALILERLESDATPEPVRQAVGLSSVQGIEFLCALTTTAAQALDLSDTVEGLSNAQNPHRLVVGVDEGVASFVQRAYREAASALLSTHVGEPAAVRQVLLTAAIAIVDNADRWQALSGLEQTAALGVLVGLAEDHPEASMRRYAGESLLLLIQQALSGQQGRDYARAAELAQRFEAGLDTRWAVEDFPLDTLDVARNALTVWHGPVAASSLARSMLVRARDATAQLGTPQTRRNLSVSLINMGRVAEAQEDWAEAHILYGEALAIRHELFSQPRTPESRRDMAEVLQLAAGVAHAKGDWPQAGTLHRESLAIFRELAAQLGTPRARRDLAVALSNVGRVERSQGRLTEAEAFYRESLAIRGELASQNLTPEAKRDVSLAFSALSRVAEDQSEWGQAEKLHRVALDISRELAAQLGTLDARRDVLWNLENLGRVAQVKEEWEEAEKLHQEGLAMCRELVSQLGQPGSRRDLAVALANLGRIADARGERERAEALYRESLAISRELAAQFGTPEARRYVSVGVEDVGAIVRQRAEWEQAEALYCESLVIGRELAAQLRTPQARRDLSVSLDNMGAVAQAQGKWTQVEALYRESLAIRRELVAQLRTPRARGDVSVSLDNMAMVAEVQSEWAQAEALYHESLAIRRELAAQLRTPQARRDLSMSLDNLGVVAQAQRRWTQAEALYRESLAIRRELVAQLGTLSDTREVGDSLLMLSELAVATADKSSACESLREAFPVFEGLARMLSTQQSIEDLEDVRQRMVEIGCELQA